MKHICIAHYDRPLDWIYKLQTDAVAVIYTTSGVGNFTPFEIPKHQVPNKGMDAPMYLSYIIDHYDNLPERVLFCHHHEYDWTQDGSLPEIINTMNWEAAPYFNIGHKDMYVNPFTLIGPEHIDIIKRNWYIFENHIEYTENLFFYCGAQFCVHKDLLLQYKRAYWQSLYDWTQTQTLTDYYSGRMFEYFWHYLLTHDPIDKNVLW